MSKKCKKSDLSNSSVGSEDLGSDLKIVGNLRKGHEADNVYHPNGISPTLRADMGGLSNRSQLILDVSGQTTSTNTPAKSIGKGSPYKGGDGKIHQPSQISQSLEAGTSGGGGTSNRPMVDTGMNQVSSMKATSEPSHQAKYLTMTSLQEGFPAKVFPLLEGVRVSKTSQEELFSSKSAVSLEIKDHATYCLRMLKDYFLTTKDERSQLYSFRWMNLGMMLNGRSSTLSIGYHKTGKGSLSSALEENADEKYYLSKKMISALTREVNNDFQGRFKRPLTEKDQSFALTSRYHKMGKTDPYVIQGHGEPLIPHHTRIRRLTPTECERLQGFPDGWTKECSDTQRYKQMGNAVSVPVITAIGESILRVINE